MKTRYLVGALVAALAFTLGSAASAQTIESNSASTTQASTGAIANIGNPVINLPGALADQRSNFHGNTAQTPATVFINPPSNDTCAMAGDAVSVQVVGGGFGASKGGSASANCETRADVLNLKVTGAPDIVIKARQCMSPAMAEAYERAGMPCTDKRKVAEAPSAQQAVAIQRSTDPYIAARLAAQGK